MYRILGTDHYVWSQSTSSPSCSTKCAIHRSVLQGRIKEACQGHLRWCFDRDVFLAPKSWPLSSKVKNGPESPGDDPGLKSSTGALHILKLFEFSHVFVNEKVFIKDCLQACANLWLDALAEGRDAKSGLWYRARQTYVPWEHHDTEESERLSLSEYRLGDHIYIWIALKFVEQMTTQHLADHGSLSSISRRLNDLDLHYCDVRKIILRRFICQNRDTGTGDHLSSSKTSTQSDLNSTERPHSEETQATYAFVVAVRRSRLRDRILFYAKDTMIYDGMQWGFFENDIEIEGINVQGEVVRADVSLAWKQTIRAQGVHHESVWRTPLRYALAIAMASCGQTLDDSKDPAGLANTSWERLLQMVTPCGLFISKINRETKLPDTRMFLDNSRSPWETAAVLLRHRYKLLDFDS